MTSRFDTCVERVLWWEGGLSDHPSDPGGLTKWGISLRALRSIGLDLNGDGVVDGRDIRGMTESQMKSIYRDRYWRVVKCDDLPVGLDLMVFDCSVNQGQGRAARLLQGVVGVKRDGAVGPVTLSAVRSRLPRETLRRYAVARALHYTGLLNFALFGRGWLNRLFSIFQYATEDEHATDD